MRFLIRLAVTAASLWVAVRLVPGISYSGDASSLLVVALVFGIVNAFVRPILFALTCPLVLLTLGLFVFVLNGAMLLLTAYVSGQLGIAFTVAGLGSAVLGGLVIGITSTVLNIFVGEEEKKDNKGR